MPFCLDANIFIEAKNRYYGLDFCPGYWDWLDREFAKGRVLCVRPIYEEIASGKDDLADWIKTRNHSDWLCKVDSEETQKAFRAVATHIESRRGHYTNDAIETFMGGGDPWLIAYCVVHRHTLVTHEVSRPDSKRRVTIPDVCQALDVNWIGCFDMLRQLNARFVLGKED